MASPEVPTPPGLAAGTLIKGRWRVGRKIGQGAFGEIYVGKNISSNELVAIKVERVDSKKQVLKLEVAYVKKLQECPQVVPFVTCGRHADFNYMIMELLGDSISELRRKQPTYKFSMRTTLQLGLQMLKAIEAIHKLGYLHRDIKPSNFAIGLAPAKRNTVVLIDFGLARRYVLPNGEVRPPRDQAGFRGTARYASINSHLSKDLGRRDDLWSLLYLLIEFAVGSLPWRRLKDKDQVGEMKMKITLPELCMGLPVEFLRFAEHLQALDYEDCPRYGLLRQLLLDLLHRVGGTEEAPFDWDLAPPPERPRPLPSLADLAYVQVAVNAERCLEMRVPLGLRKRLVELVLKIKQGAVGPALLTRLLDASLTELDLSPCAHMPESTFNQVFSHVTRLKTLALGQLGAGMVKALTSGNRQLESLSFDCGPGFTHKHLKTLGGHFTNLTTLRLRNTDKVNDSHIEPILRACPRLETLALPGCKKIRAECFQFLHKQKKKGKPVALRSLDLSGCELSKKGWKYMISLAADIHTLTFAPLATSSGKIGAADFIQFVHSCKALRNLEMRHQSFDHFEMDSFLMEFSRSGSQLHSLLLEGPGTGDYGLLATLQTSMHLQTLRFSYGDVSPDISIYQVAKFCTDLTSLTIDFASPSVNTSRIPVPLSQTALRNLLGTMSTLRDLALPSCALLSPNCFPSHMPHLTSLGLMDCFQLTDDCIQTICEACPQLRKLQLDGLNYLSELALQSVSNMCPMLEELSLLHCACFPDYPITTMLKSMPRLFIKATRYTEMDPAKAVAVQLHFSSAEQQLSSLPNTHRELALERAHKRGSRN